MTDISKKLIAVCLLFFLSCPAFSQDAADTENNGDHRTLQSIMSLSENVGWLIQSHFASMEALTTNDTLIAAIKADDKNILQTLSISFQIKLQDSLKVRLFIRGQEEVDNISTPACGFACIGIVRAAYDGKPEAEALLFRSPDANITLARGIYDSSGQAIGAIAVHYPFKQLKNEIEKLTTTAVFTEIRQRVASKPVVLFSHGDRTIKQGPAQKFIRIPQSRWAIAVWTPGGVSIETYEPPAIPWLYIALAAVVLIVGIAILIIYRIKNPAIKQKKVKPIKTLHSEAASSEAISYDHEHDSPTLILGGGAEDIDVSQYLQDSDITDLKNKLK